MFMIVQGHVGLLISPSEADIFLAGCAHFVRITWPKRQLPWFNAHIAMLIEVRLCAFRAEYEWYLRVGARRRKNIGH